MNSLEDRISYKEMYLMYKNQCEEQKNYILKLEKENQELIVNKNVAQAVAFDQKREIGELKDKIAYLQEESENWQSAYELSQSKNAIIKLENQELKITVSEYKAQENLYWNTAINNANLREENEKLKKDYNLLDTTMESDDRIICELLKEKEQLQNDIKLNETQIDDLTLEVANYKHALEEKNEIIMDLKEKLEISQKANKELSFTANAYAKAQKPYIEKIQKLEKAIEILKDKLEFEDLGEMQSGNVYRPYFNDCFDQQEYELLKEVLE